MGKKKIQTDQVMKRGHEFFRRKEQNRNFMPTRHWPTVDMSSLEEKNRIETLCLQETGQLKESGCHYAITTQHLKKL